MEIEKKFKAALVLLILEELENRSLTPIREFDLHQIVRKVQTPEFSPFSYVDQPISFSFDLGVELENLEKGACLEELLFVKNEWQHRLAFRLSTSGRIKARDDQNCLGASYPEVLSLITREVLDFAEKQNVSPEISL